MVPINQSLELHVILKANDDVLFNNSMKGKRQHETDVEELIANGQIKVKRDNTHPKLWYKGKIIEQEKDNPSFYRIQKCEDFKIFYIHKNHILSFSCIPENPCRSNRKSSLYSNHTNNNNNNEIDISINDGDSNNVVVDVISLLSPTPVSSEYCAWMKHTSRFGMKYLEKYGYKYGRGIGKGQDGQRSPVPVHIFSKNSGLGFNKHDIRSLDDIQCAMRARAEEKKKCKRNGSKRDISLRNNNNIIVLISSPKNIIPCFTC
ncbi:eukaryotic translation initiation factor 2 alpha kinase [Reticulomyxa filosa]|uniref:Eukaryotic translation initiation factor 2 alpha kinase n=1 Tax=Reticulomyxa filosa TaxID=46433 RepID=X6N127_RETFI|nr:eukaryotic translation initiation factor 2 alpha kinase [Reticulomyxa filosa]|eukprot:ETO19409.1 eukaryotic translation initiation factor 2 alpha kinase [Reticulomyxa filosa]